MSYYVFNKKNRECHVYGKEKFMKLMKEHSPHGKQTNGTSKVGRVLLRSRVSKGQ